MAGLLEGGALLDLIGNLGNTALSEIGKIVNVESEARKLESTLLKMQTMVDKVEFDFASYPLTNPNCKKVWDDWLLNFNSIVYGLNIVFDDLLGLGSDASAAHLKISAANKVSGYLKEVEKLEELTDYFFKMVVVKSEMTKQMLRENFCRFGVSSSIVDERVFVGREEQKAQVLAMLFPECKEQNVSVISITGMGGIGKTAFAQLLFNDKKVNGSFKLKIWVSLPVEFDLIRVTRSILESALMKRCDLTELETLQSTLQRLLRLQKCLLVLDGYWSERYEDWDLLFSPFKDAREGTKIIITTRIEKVSSIVGANSFHLPPLSDDDCWKIMKQRVVGEENTLELMGLKIANKCRGLPLVAKMLGGVLRSIPDEWESILERSLWDFPEFEQKVLSILMISYYCLPPNLKKCFSYCALFPIGYEFEIDNLVHLWIANRLIQPIGERRLEDIGREYVKDLLSKSFFYQHDCSCPNFFKMHDFIRNMAQLISVNISYQIEDMSSSYYSLLEKYHHLSVCPGINQSVQLERFPKCDKLRTFLWLCGSDSAVVGEKLISLVTKFTILRVLDLSYGGITDLDALSLSKHLRYLNLSGNDFVTLPDSVSGLHWLETLLLNQCPLLTKLPKRFNKLINLRHFEFAVQAQLQKMPKGFGELVNLQTLFAFIVGEGEGYGINELKEMRHLRGSICISRLDKVISEDEAKTASLSKKPWIENLELKWNHPGNSDIQYVVSDTHIQVLSGLQPHEKLKGLKITDYCGVSFPTWLYDQHCFKLKAIHLKDCHKCVDLPHFGDLQFLEKLIIENISEMKKIKSDFFGIHGSVGFPSLKSLQLINMPQLTILEPRGDLDMPQLCDLNFECCPKLISLPPLNRLSSLRNLYLRGCGELGHLPAEELPLSIQTVRIRDCPILNVDWSKVRRMPMVTFA